MIEERYLSVVLCILRIVVSAVWLRVTLPFGLQMVKLELLVAHIKDPLAKLLSDYFVLLVCACHIEGAAMSLVNVVQGLLKTSLNLASVALNKSLTSQL